MTARALLLLSALAIAGCGLWNDKSEERRRSSELYVRKGVAYLEAGRYEQALADLERALDFNSRNSEAHNALAVLYERLDKQDDALSHYKRAVSLDENNYGALNNYSRFLCSHGNYEEGVQMLEQVISSRLYAQPWLVLTNKGICYKSAGRVDEAERILREALESSPDFAPALLELARIAFEKKEYLTTRAFLQRYAGAAQHTAETLLLGVRTEEALGNQASVRNYLGQLLDKFRDSPEAAEAKKSYPAR